MSTTILQDLMMCFSNIMVHTRDFQEEKQRKWTESIVREWECTSMSESTLTSPYERLEQVDIQIGREK